MAFVIIGSGAIKHWLPNFRKPHDYDFIGTPEEIAKLEQNLKTYNINYKLEKRSHYWSGWIEPVKNKRIFIQIEIAHKDSPVHKNESDTGYELVQTLKNSQKYRLAVNQFIDIEYVVPPLEYMLAIKDSHRYQRINWHKHRADIELLQKVVDRSLQDKTLNFLIKRSEEAQYWHPIRTPKLNQTADNFFGESNAVVKALYVHDDLHEIVAHEDKPAYIEMINGPVKVSRRLWEAMSHKRKIDAVLEEAYVIALERVLVPWYIQGRNTKAIKLFDTLEENAKAAFEWAVMRIGTDLTSGWFRDFCTDNRVEVLSRYNEDYWHAFYISKNSLSFYREN